MRKVRGQRKKVADELKEVVELAARLRKRRRDLEMSQTLVGRRAGVSHSAISNLEKAKTKKPNWFTVTKVAKALQIEELEALVPWWHK